MQENEDELLTLHIKRNLWFKLVQNVIPDHYHNSGREYRVPSTINGVEEIDYNAGRIS